MKIGLLETGNPPGDLAETYGSYSAMFEALLGPEHSYRVYDVQKGELPADPAENDAYVITGSAAGVYDPLPWIEPLKSFLRQAKGEAPMVGVCFGHQLLAHLLGAPVRRNPKGREIGTISCTLTEAGRRDPLFEGIPAEFEVQATHEDLVSEPSPRFELLAGTANTAIQSFRSGSRIRGVQFHPEVDVDTMRALIEARTAKLEAEAAANGLDPKERMRELYAGLRCATFGGRVIAYLPLEPVRGLFS